MSIASQVKGHNWHPFPIFPGITETTMAANLQSLIPFLFALALLGQDAKAQATYPELTTLFKEWCAFEHPPLWEGAPDYTAETFEKRWPEFKKL